MVIFQNLMKLNLGANKKCECPNQTYYHSYGDMGNGCHRKQIYSRGIVVLFYLLVVSFQGPLKLLNSSFYSLFLFQIFKLNLATLIKTNCMQEIEQRYSRFWSPLLISLYQFVTSMFLLLLYTNWEPVDHINLCYFQRK